MSPYLPITPEQIAGEAIDAARAGAATVHIHARNPENGMPSPDLDLFHKIVEKIHSETDVIICITTGGGPGMTVDQRAAPVTEFKPELASFNMGSINFALFPAIKKYNEWKYEWEKPFLEASKANIFQNTFADLEKICGIMRDNGTKPELEIYDVAHLYNAKFLLSEGFLEPPAIPAICHGDLGGNPANLFRPAPFERNCGPALRGIRVSVVGFWRRADGVSPFAQWLRLWMGTVVWGLRIMYI